jgi:hypothetical protein
MLQVSQSGKELTQALTQRLQASDQGTVQCDGSKGLKPSRFQNWKKNEPFEVH